MIVHVSPDSTPSNEELSSHLNTRDSGCQTEDFLIPGAPARRRIRVHKGQAGSLLLSHSAGNITCLSDSADATFTASVVHLRSRSLPRDGSRMMDSRQNDSDDEEKLTEGFLPGQRERILEDQEESTDEQAMLGLEYKQLSESPERTWMERTRAQLPRNMGSCEMSSSSDTFSSPIHSVSAAGGLAGPMDHKDEHQSSSGNWSGSNSTCPSQTSETIPPAASPLLTGSSHCDSELSLNAASHANDEQTSLDHYQVLRTQRVGSFSSTAMDILEEVGVTTAVEGDWGYPPTEASHSQGFSPEPSREAESSLGCPSFTSMATCESSFSDKPPSEKADAVSHYSVDTEGYYTSMHFDCGLKESRSFTYNYPPSGSDYALSGVSGHLTLGRRCLSLRKPKVKPSPPKRSSSLRKICSEGNICEKNKPKITHSQQLPLSSKERKMQLALFGSQGYIENSSLVREPLVVWGVEASTDLPDLGVLHSKDAHSFKKEGAVQSDYADLWLLNDLKSSDPYRSLSNSSTATGTTVIECIKSQEGSESQTSQSGSRATTPSLPSVEGELKLTSPEKLAGLASPSSGYSSQSETPTSSFPSTFFPGPLSPAGGKRKPKVPERKSSLSSWSLQSYKDVAASKRDVELPVTPPPHLDLSALHSNNKASAGRIHYENTQQNQQEDGVNSRPVEVFTAHALSITPSMLQSVQLQPASKERQDKNRTACHAEYFTSNKPLELKDLPLHNFYHDESSKESSELVYTSNEELVTEDRHNQNQGAPLEIAPADGQTAESCLNTPETLTGLERELNTESPVPSTCSVNSHSPQQKSELPEDEMCPTPPVLHSSPKRSNSLTEVPAADSQLETSQESSISNDSSIEMENDSSGVSAESALQDGRDESMEETENPDCKGTMSQSLN